MARNLRIGRTGGDRRLTSLAAAFVISRGGVTPTPSPTPAPAPTPTPGAIILSRDYLDDGGLNSPYYPASAGPNAIYAPSLDKTVVGVTRWNGVTGTRDVSTYVVDNTGRITGPAVAFTDISDETGPLDTHGPASLSDFDPAFSLWYGLGGGHNNPVKLAYSSDPATSWTYAMNSGSGTNYTYSKPFIINGVLYNVMRRNDTSAQVKAGELWRVDRNGTGIPTAFSKVSTIIHLGQDSRFYSGDFVKVGNEVIFTATRANFNDDYRKNVYIFVLQFDSAGAFIGVRNLANTASTLAASLPVDQTTMDASYRVVDQTTLMTRGQVPSMVRGPNGNLHIAHIDFADADASNTTGNVATIYHTEVTLTGVIVSGPSAISTAPTWSLYTIGATASGVEVLFPRVSAVANQYGGAFARGGDMMLAARPDGGTWAAATLVRAASRLAGLSRPTKVRHAPVGAALKYVFAETAEQQDTYGPGIGSLRSYAYGAAGNVSFTVAEDPDTTAYINRGIALGAAVPSATWRTAYDAVIRAAKRIGVTATRDCGYLHVAHDRIQARVNLFGSAYTGAEVGSAGWSSTGGYTPDGVTFRFDTGFNPSTAPSPKFVVDKAAVDYHTILTSRNASPIVGCMPGGANPSFYHNPKTTADNMNGRFNDAAAFSTSIGTGAGAYAFHFRRAPTTKSHARNGGSMIADATNPAVTAVPDTNLCAYGNGTTYDTRSLIGFFLGAWNTGEDQRFVGPILARYGYDTGAIA